MMEDGEDSWDHNDNGIRVEDWNSAPGPLTQPPVKGVSPQNVRVSRPSSSLTKTHGSLVQKMRKLSKDILNTRAVKDTGGSSGKLFELILMHVCFTGVNRVAMEHTSPRRGGLEGLLQSLPKHTNACPHLYNAIAHH